MSAAELVCNHCGDVAFTSQDIDDDGVPWFTDGAGEKCDSCGMPGHLVVDDEGDVDAVGRAHAVVSWSDSEDPADFCTREDCEDCEERRATAAPQWFRTPPNREGMFAFVDLVRSPDDPERRQSGREAGDVAPHLTIAKTPPADWLDPIAKHLGDGTPRTLNRIAIEMIDKTADVIFGTTFHEAVWLLVEQGRVEYTSRSPVLFRAVTA